MDPGFDGGREGPAVGDTRTVLVLTPTMDGHYFGELVAGLTREVAGAGGRLVVVITRPEGVPRDEVGVPGDFSTPVAWSLVDGVVSITTAVGRPYLQQLRDAGKAVVLSSTVMSGFAAPAAMPDNHGGTYAAVEHLIWHGHTRIGFVGNLAQQDIRERYAAYLAALTAHGLSVDAGDFFAAPDNGETGGVHAGHQMLAQPGRPTAVMVGNDGNALGLMRALTDGGMVLPRDLAIIGYDNTETGAFSLPALSSVNQRFEEVGSLAGRLVIAAMRGQDVPDAAATPPSVVLTVRSSCGCPAGGPERGLRTGARSARAPADVLREELREGLLTALDAADRWFDPPTRDAVLGTVRAAEQLMGSTEDEVEARIRALAASMLPLTSRPDLMRRVIAAVSAFVEEVAALGATTPVVSPTRVVGELWKVQAGAFLRRTEAVESAIVEQYAVDGGLLDTSTTDPRGLEWLAGTHVKAGVLALWQGEPSTGTLVVAGAYDPTGVVPDVRGMRLTAETFPPEPLISAVVAAQQEVCVVVPVRTATRDWGLLAVVGTIDTTSARETYQHWAALLCVALESQRLQEDVRRSALYDALTELPNRRLFLDRLGSAIARNRRSGTPFAVLFLDLDGFKRINDSLGHQMGDRVLAAVGERLGRELREVDTSARFGGDEFAILLHDTDADGALNLAHRVQVSLGAPLELDGADLSIGASIGIATSAADELSSEDVLRDADAAMYRAKASGQGAVVHFDDEMRARAAREQGLHAEIRVALDDAQFGVFFQPIIDLRSGCVRGLEALVRWHHPRRGLVLPEEFLPAMEETGLIVRLGHWVLDEVCRRLVEWGAQAPRVSINVSDREFWQQGMLAHVMDTLASRGLGPDRLTLEIAEGALRRHPERALRLAREIHDAGLRLQVDDVGSGYSSVEVLHGFPLDGFAIDRSVVQGLAGGDRTGELVSALVGLGAALGLDVLAEGVETDEQLSLLRRAGCAAAQGNLVAPAVAASELPDLLESVRRGRRRAIGEDAAVSVGTHGLDPTGVQ